MSLVKLAASGSSIVRFSNIVEKNAPKELLRLMNRNVPGKVLGQGMRKYLDPYTRQRFEHVIDNHLLSKHTARSMFMAGVSEGERKEMFRQMEHASIHAATPGKNG